MPGGVCELRHVPKLFANVVYVRQGPARPTRSRKGRPRPASRHVSSLRCGPAPLTPKTYCFASSRTLIRD
jgi:hypothetical protein